VKRSQDRFSTVLVRAERLTSVSEVDDIRDVSCSLDKSFSATEPSQVDLGKRHVVVKRRCLANCSLEES